MSTFKAKRIIDPKKVQNIILGEKKMMKEKHELENQILGIFQEKGKGANKIVLQMLKPTTPLKKRAVIRNPS